VRCDVLEQIKIKPSDKKKNRLAKSAGSSLRTTTSSVIDTVDAVISLVYPCSLVGGRGLVQHEYRHGTSCRAVGPVGSSIRYVSLDLEAHKRALVVETYTFLQSLPLFHGKSASSGGIDLVEALYKLAGRATFSTHQYRDKIIAKGDPAAQVLS